MYPPLHKIGLPEHRIELDLLFYFFKEAGRLNPYRLCELYCLLLSNRFTFWAFVFADSTKMSTQF